MEITEALKLIQDFIGLFKVQERVGALDPLSRITLEAYESILMHYKSNEMIKDSVKEKGESNE